MGPDPYDPGIYRGYFIIWLIARYFWKYAGIRAVRTENQGIYRKGGSKGGCSTDTLIIFRITRPDYGGIYLKVGLDSIDIRI